MFYVFNVLWAWSGLCIFMDYVYTEYLSVYFFGKGYFFTNLLCLVLIVVTLTTRSCRITTTSRRVWMSAACTALTNTLREAAIASSQRSWFTAAGRLRGSYASFTQPGHSRSISETSSARFMKNHWVHSAVSSAFESCCFAFVCSVRFYSFFLKQKIVLLILFVFHVFIWSLVYLHFQWSITEIINWIIWIQSSLQYTHTSHNTSYITHK